MFTNLLSASLNNADYALFGICAFIFLVCLARGFSKSLYGFLFSLVVILSSLYISGLATDPLIKTPLGQQFYGAVDSWGGSWGEAFNCEISFENGTAVIYPAGSTEAVKLSDAIGGNVALGFLADKIVPKIIPAEGGMSINDVIIPNITYIFGFLIVFVLSIIALKILFRIIDSFWDKVTTNGTRRKGLDKFMGAVISVIYSGTLVLFVLAIIGVLADKTFLASTVQEIRNSEFCSWVFANNPILTLFIRLFVG